MSTAKATSAVAKIKRYGKQNHTTQTLKPGQVRRLKRTILRQLVHASKLRGAAKIAGIRRAERESQTVPGLLVIASTDGKSFTVIKKGNK
jgi:hypothetical protein